MTQRDATPGEPFLYIYRLKDGAGPEYDRRHADVWPAMLELLMEAGIDDYQIWRHEEIVVCRLRARADSARPQGFLMRATSSADGPNPHPTCSIQSLWGTASRCG